MSRDGEPFDLDDFDDEDFRDAPPDPPAGEPDADGLGPLGRAADRLAGILAQETELARTGGLGDFHEVIQAKQDALAEFTELARDAEQGAATVAADGDAVRRMMAVADENAQVLEAVRTTIDDMSTRLRRALTAMADPETYGPKARGPRFAMAAKIDTKI